VTQMTHAYDWHGRDVVGSDGEKIGTLTQVYVDTTTDAPEWAAVSTGLFGTKQSFVPITDAAPEGESVRVPHTKDEVKNAPRIDPDGELNSEEEQTLYAHYRRSYEAPPQGEPVGRDTSGPTTDDAMTRSEEELRVGTAQRERGRVRLRKYVVTEQAQQTVPVRREEVRVEREPITDGNVDKALDGPEISDEEHEVTLHEEEVVTEKRAVPKERVRLSKDTITDEETVSDDVRKEQIEVEGDR
jgi:uncharacterized protein (TIGR02271 family)